MFGLSVGVLLGNCFELDWGMLGKLIEISHGKHAVIDGLVEYLG